MDLRTESISVRFVGEAAADVGGPLSEFLTLCMRNIWKCGIFHGSQVDVYFKDSPASFIN